MSDAYCFVPNRAGMDPSYRAAARWLDIAVARCYGRSVWVHCRPNPHWGFRRWPGEVLRWRRAWCEVRFWCGPVAEVRWVHYSRIDPRQ